ncbi:cytochrome c5 family protein [Chitinimonas arctica]|uniref:Cytochrome c5 family protein n=2 Tax=Chitinimonas arctica TaxID=2594795 RepID=A0A516SM61_9NEIS|nr:cytochrome c5 family protein [Chitinimonas arctica]
MSAKALIGIVLAAIVGIPVFILLVIQLATGGMKNNAASPSMTNEAVLARIQPIGLAKLDDSGPPGSRNGKAVYESVCMSCHAAGLAGSPKFADAGAWGARISKGFATLVEHANKGLGAMPAKGGAADLTDDEVARAVAYMGNAVGAKFTEPPVAAGAAAGGKIDPAVKGKEIYDSVCVACHGTGVAGAPKFADKAAWASRLKGGVEEAIKTAAKGINAMPAKGGYTGSDAEFHAAAEYLINASK